MAKQIIAAEIKVKGLSGLARFDALYKKKKGKMFSTGIKILGFLVERESKISITELGAVDTGRLRASILTEIKSDGLSGIVEPNTDYEYDVHEGLGTNKAKGRRPFMEIGANRAEDQFAKEWEGIVDSKFGEIVTEIKNLNKLEK